MTLADDAHERALGVTRQGSAEADGGGGGVGARNRRRSTRMQKEPVYDRALPWQSQVEADWLRGSGFPGEDGEGAVEESQEEKVAKVKMVVEDDEE
jgi:hypothetical protein